MYNNIQRLVADRNGYRYTLGDRVKLRGHPYKGTIVFLHTWEDKSAVRYDVDIDHEDAIVGCREHEIRRLILGF